MKKNDDIVLDELKICYLADDKVLAPLGMVEAGEFADIFGYRFYRLTNDRFRFFYEITSAGTPVAQLKYGHYTDQEDKATHVFYKVLNPILYDKEILRQALDLPAKMGLAFNNYTELDLACDIPNNIPSLIKRLMRDKSVTTIINGKAVTDRKAVLKGVMFDYSTSLNRLINPTITLRQKKAETNKARGITVQAYDKKAEIAQCSGKDYILEYYDNPSHLYRLEVRIPYQEIKDYFANRKITPGLETIFDAMALKDMFLYHLGSVIRFSRGRRKIPWDGLLRML